MKTLLSSARSYSSFFFFMFLVFLDKLTRDGKLQDGINLHLVDNF